MNLQKTAKEIVKTMGGTENIVHLTHCMTRLRFKLRDESIVSKDALEHIDGVLGTANVSGIYQVIIGTSVDQMYDEIQNNYLKGKTAKEDTTKKDGIVSRILELVSSTLSPLIPAIMGAGFISIMLAVFSQLGILASDSQTYVILNGIANCVYYFFPVLIALSLASRLKVNQIFAVVSACFLLYPDFINMFQGGETAVSFLGIPVAFATYSKQIIPIFFSVFCQKYIEKVVYHFTPKVIRTMVGSGIILILTILVTIVVLGPLGDLMTQGLNAVVYFVVDTCGWVAIPIMSFLNPIFLGTGLGTANFPIMLMSYVNNGYEALILPAALAGNAVQAGSGFAISLKSKNKEFKSISFECAITALMGITEPIIFSVHYRLKKTFITVMIGSAIAAILPGVTGVACYALANGILSIPAYLPGGVMNMVWAIATIALGLVVGFVLTYLTKFDDPKDESYEVEEELVTEETGNEDSTIKTVAAPITGTLVHLEDLADESFKSKKMGEGIAIQPEDGKVVSPVDGEVVSLFPTKHAIGIRSKEGIEILIHIGMDTVNLNGKYFKAYVKEHDQVKKGDLLIEMDIAGLKKENVEITTPVIITNTKDYLDVFATSAKEVKAGDKLLTII